MKKVICALFAALLVIGAASCSSGGREAASTQERAGAVSGETETGGVTDPGQQEDDAEEPAQAPKEEEVKTLRMTIGDADVSVEWEENESVDAIERLVADSPLTIEMSMYGGFEQVGDIGSELPSNDERTTTEAGDIVLYSGDRLVVFYGPNSWSYTRLGRITGKTPEELMDILGTGDVTITLYLYREQP